ncbi:uncharacterized protein LOC119688621 [Teleopsis dalmanni]|uniref:uncharacterized protein LOC119688621 n=1 Tax=Teleopsis dalmanni TaxID=139649 RepID=UPI0018CDB4DA|nr:uncharacterized protein LOC119688621 [Teleopsis dalmanni]
MAKVLQKCHIIVWDECTMAQSINRTLKDLNANYRLFGGTLILLAGSIYADEINACLKSSILWRSVHILRLTENMRVGLQRDLAAELFAKQLLDIVNGNVSLQKNTHFIKLPENFCKIVSSKVELIENVFPHIYQNYQNHQCLQSRAKNLDVDEINSKIQAMLPGNLISLKSIDTVVDENEIVNYPTEFLNSLDLPGLPPHNLLSKVGSPIILLRNLNPPKLCNGTRLVIKIIMGNLLWELNQQY